MTNRLELTVSYPPSVNKIWRRGRNGVYLDPAVKIFRDQITHVLEKNQITFGESKVSMTLHLYPPRKSCDIDNCLKSILDGLEKCGVYQNDVQVTELHVYKHGHTKAAFSSVKIIVQCLSSQ